MTTMTKTDVEFAELARWGFEEKEPYGPPGHRVAEALVGRGGAGPDGATHVATYESGDGTWSVFAFDVKYGGLSGGKSVKCEPTDELGIEPMLASIVRIVARQSGVTQREVRERCGVGVYGKRGDACRKWADDATYACER